MRVHDDSPLEPRAWAATGYGFVWVATSNRGLRLENADFYISRSGAPAMFRFPPGGFGLHMGLASYGRALRLA
jgi:hypothetical protein